jgi:hypothetical protein
MPDDDVLKPLRSGDRDDVLLAWLSQTKSQRTVVEKLNLAGTWVSDSGVEAVIEHSPNSNT